MPISSIIESTETRRRWLAFLITTAAVFVLLCSLWPLTVRGFRSSAALAINRASDKSDEQLREELTEAVLAETSDDQLAAVIDTIEQSGNLKSARIEYRDFQTIRESIRVGLFDDQVTRRFQIAFEGEGGSDERQLVDILTYRVASRLNEQFGTGALGLNERVEQLDWIVQQMEHDLGFVKSSFAQISSGTQLDPQSNELTLEAAGNRDSSASSFHLASSKRNAAPTLDDIENSIRSIDIETLRDVVSGLKVNLSESQTGQSDLNSSAPTGLKLNGMKPSKTLPINGVPSVPFLLLLGGLSAMLGSVVAWNYDPFSKKGFADSHSVRNQLKVPVLGTLNLTSQHSATSVPIDGDGSTATKPQERFANRFVRYSGIFLVCTAAIVLTFVLLNSEVRQAFFENPFFGCAKIVRAFAGY